MINFAAIMPHPPILISGIGSQEDLVVVRSTLQAMEELRRDFEAANPETVVVISPHAPLDSYSFGVNKSHTLKGDLKRFGSDEQFSFHNDLEFADKILYAAEMNNELPAHAFHGELDHGAMVPLHFLTQNLKPKLVHLSFSQLSLSMHYDYGEIIGKILGDSHKEVAVIASGDLSHRLVPEAPAGYSERGGEFDRSLISCLKRDDWKSILDFKPDFIEAAGECGLRSFVILLGILKNRNLHFQKLSYEGPFGVGYLAAKFLS